MIEGVRPRTRIFLGLFSASIVSLMLFLRLLFAFLLSAQIIFKQDGNMSAAVLLDVLQPPQVSMLQAENAVPKSYVDERYNKCQSEVQVLKRNCPRRELMLLS